MWKFVISAAVAITASSVDAKVVQERVPTMHQSPFHRGVNVLGYDP